MSKYKAWTLLKPARKLCLADKANEFLCWCI